MRTHRPAAVSARVPLGLLSGLIALGAALGAALLAAAAGRPEANPVTAVGEAVIDRTPAPVKDFAIRTFGEDDKLWLQGGILVLLALFAAGLGVLGLRHRVAAAAGGAGFGLVGVVAALSRPDARATDVLPSVAAGLAAAGVLYLLSGRLSRPQPGVDAPHPPGSPDGSGGFDRRGFVVAAASAALASAGAAAVGARLGASGAAEARASRAAVRLPRPASPAPPVPAGADLGIDGVAPFTTPNGRFYRVDTALTVPRLDATAWRMRLHGRGVRRELSLSFADLLRRPLVERDITLTCVSNEVGGPYVGNARWIGVPLAELLREAGVRPPSQGGPADQLVARSQDGMTIGTPVETVMDGRDALLALGMNGQPLPFVNGFPVRMVVPGLYGYVSACKWLVDLELTTFDAYDAYWVRRNWAAKAPIKTMTRIDTPKPFSAPAAGRVPVAGVAWAQHRGVDRVEVRVDGGEWNRARLAAEDSPDTWRQWVWEWPATSGSHRLEARAVDGTGATQTAQRAGTVPDGASGWHSVVVNVP